jgi:C1A family cysteine protease
MFHLPKRQSKRFGWRRQLPDHRDFLYSAPFKLLETLPPTFDLAAEMPPIYDQLQTNSCTGNSSGSLVEHRVLLQGEPDLKPSRLFIYYNGRDIEGDADQDNGAEIRDVMKSINKVGVCDESIWPFDLTMVVARPSNEAFNDAQLHHSIQYSAVQQTPMQIKAAIFDHNPIVFGFAVFESIDSVEVARTGIVPMPRLNEQCIGGHAVVIVGYDDTTQLFKIRNSWGVSHGDKGHLYLPYSYVLDQNLSSDFWVLSLMN